MRGISGKDYPEYSQKLYDRLESFSRHHRNHLISMIDDIHESETSLCGKTYFQYTTEEYSNLSDDCIVLGELERILTKIADRNFSEL